MHSMLLFFNFPCYAYLRSPFLASAADYLFENKGITTNSYFLEGTFGVDIFLRNCSFFTLFVSMIFYWIQTAFSSSITSPAKQLPAKHPEFFKKLKDVTGTITMIISNLLLMFLLIFRWKESGHFPLSNLYESLMFLSWSCTSIHLVLELNTEIIRPDAILLKRCLGSITSPIALFTNAFATFNLPAEMQKASPLVPALQSNWLMMHVTVMIISYSALILGSLLSIAFLILISSLKNVSLLNLSTSAALPRISFVPEAARPPIFTILGRSELTSLYTAAVIGRSMPEASSEKQDSDIIAALPGLPKVPVLRSGAVEAATKAKMTLAWNFDNLSYRVLGIGFPFLTIGILSGAVWANEAWGSYWSWDPKETWALLTWLIFAIYLHARITKGWQGKKPAIIASFGFLAIWICFLGVNLIGEGLHSYGWFST